MILFAYYTSPPNTVSFINTKVKVDAVVRSRYVAFLCLDLVEMLINQVAKIETRSTISRNDV